MNNKYNLVYLILYSYIHIYSYIQIYTYIHIYIQIYTYIYKYILMYTSACSNFRSSSATLHREANVCDSEVSLSSIFRRSLRRSLRSMAARL